MFTETTPRTGTVQVVVIQRERDLTTPSVAITHTRLQRVYPIFFMVKRNILIKHSTVIPSYVTNQLRLRSTTYQCDSMFCGHFSKHSKQPTMGFEHARIFKTWCVNPGMRILPATQTSPLDRIFPCGSDFSVDGILKSKVEVLKRCNFVSLI